MTVKIPTLNDLERLQSDDRSFLLNQVSRGALAAAARHGEADRVETILKIDRRRRARKAEK